MRIRLKGINSKRKRLADGTLQNLLLRMERRTAVARRAGNAGIRRELQRSGRTKVVTPQGRLLSVLQAYQASGEFNGLAARTRFDYIGWIKVIEAEFGDFPTSGLTDRRTRGIFMAWRDKLAAKSRRQADYAWSVFARILSWALNRGLVSANPCARGGRLYRGSRVDKIWTADDEAAFLKSAPAHFHLPLLLALWTGQRQGDLLRLPWSAYDGTHIRLRQSKTGVARHDPGRRAAQGRARCRTETRAADPDEQLSPPVDIARLSNVVAHRRDQGWHRRSHISRSARHRRHAPCDRRMQRTGDRHHHRPQPARRALDPRCQLSASRSGARRERDQQTRKRNESGHKSPDWTPD